MNGSEAAFDPGVLLAMWAAGVAGTAAVVAHLRLVGSGYLWLISGTVALIGGSAWFFDAGTSAAVGVIVAVAVVPLVGRATVATMAFGSSALLLLAAATGNGGLLAATTGAMALGGTTGEMLLGHWYLVDPRIPRRPLRILAISGAVGVGVDAIVNLVPDMAGIAWTPMLLASISLAAAGVILMVAVWFALAQPSYPGVMAATGLSYLAVITALGSVMTTRAVGVGVSFLG